MLIPGALTKIDTAKEHLGIDVADVSNDTTLGIYINAFSEYVSKYIGRKLELQSAQTLLIDGTGGERLYLPIAPVVLLTSVTQDGVAVSSGDYVASKDSGVLRLKNNKSWPVGSGNIVVVGNFGYTMPNDEGTRTLPYDLELACLKAVGGVYNKRTAEGASSASSGGMNVNWGKVIKDEDISAILAPYKSYLIIGG